MMRSGNRRIKRHKPEEKPSSSEWLTTFNDLVTLLMVFFVLLFSMGSIDTKKAEKMKDGLRSALGILEQGSKKQVMINDAQLKLFEIATKEENPVDDGESDKDKLEKIGDDKVHHNKEREDRLKKLNDDPDIKARHIKEGLLITLENNILFRFGKGRLNPEGFHVLDKIVNLVKNRPDPIRVEGHTDNIPIHTETFPSNWELSIARAVGVVKYFIEKGGLKPDRLSAVGYGESRPIGSNLSPIGRSENRRVEIIIVDKKESSS